MPTVFDLFLPDRVAQHRPFLDEMTYLLLYFAYPYVTSLVTPLTQFTESHLFRIEILLGYLPFK